jgi:hypothetical protein
VTKAETARVRRVSRFAGFGLTDRHCAEYAAGANEMFAEFLPNAQGEDIVAGIRTPMPIAELERTMPEVYQKLESVTRKLEAHYRDVQASYRGGDGGGRSDLANGSFTAG